MPKKTAAQRDAERRAEARRRSRLVAQGRSVEEGEDEPEAVPSSPKRSMSFFERIFPPAAPLPGKPAPLTGFTYQGRMRPIVLTGWLIRQNLYAGLGMGLLWAGSYILVGQVGSSLVGTVASFVSFGALVAAGWLGWRRPWFYGLVASVFGYLVYAPYFIVAYTRDTRFSDPASATYVPTTQVVTYLVTNGLLQAGIGAIAGFYGGYLRRRIADPATRQATATRRRR